MKERTQRNKTENINSTPKDIRRIFFNIICVILMTVIVAVVVISCIGGFSVFHKLYSDGVEQIDLNTIYLNSSGVEVNFSDVILSSQNEMRKLIVSTQKGTVSAELTERLIKNLDFGFLKKTQTVSYTANGYFVVDLDNLTKDNITVDREKKTITIRIGHAYLQSIDINPNDIIIDEVQEGLLARGDVELTLSDYNVIEKELRERLEAKFNTVENGQKADDIALDMVKEIYEPVIKAIDKSYIVNVVFA